MANATNYSNESFNASNYNDPILIIGVLLLETGDNFLLENGDKLSLVENAIKGTDYSKTSTNATNYS